MSLGGDINKEWKLYCDPTFEKSSSPGAVAHTLSSRPRPTAAGQCVFCYEDQTAYVSVERSAVAQIARVHLDRDEARFEWKVDTRTPGFIHSPYVTLYKTPTENLRTCCWLRTCLAGRWSGAPA